MIYVVQESNRNLTPAREYGNMRVVLPAKVSIVNGIMEVKKAFSQFREEDYLLLIGQSLFTSLAFMLAAGVCELLQLLVWNSRTYSYDVIVVNTTVLTYERIRNKRANARTGKAGQ